MKSAKRLSEKKNFAKTKSEKKDSPSHEFDEVDKASADSFPASDPPGWWR